MSIVYRGTDGHVHLVMQEARAPTKWTHLDLFLAASEFFELSAEQQKRSPN